MGPLSLSSYGVFGINEVVVNLIVISLSFYIIYLVGKVGGLLENFDLNAPTKEETSKTWGGDLIVVTNILLTSENL